MKRDRDQEDIQSMDWSFPDAKVIPEGGDRRFQYGSLKGMTFIDLTMEHPEQFLTCCKSKNLSNLVSAGINTEMTDYVTWVKRHFEIDKHTMEVRHVGAADERLRLGARASPLAHASGDGADRRCCHS